MRRALILLGTLAMAGCQLSGFNMASLNINKGIPGLIAQELVAAWDSIATTVGSLVVSQLGLITG